MRFEDLAPAVI